MFTKELHYVHKLQKYKTLTLCELCFLSAHCGEKRLLIQPL